MKINYYPTTAISDGQNGEGFVGHGIQVIRDDLVLAGKVITVQLPVGENGAVLEALLLAEEGDVLVVDARGDCNRAVAGDFVISMMQKVGIAGLIVNGVIRDLEAVRSLDFPVFCKGTTVVAGVKNGGGKVNVPVSLGAVSISPGDYVFADLDGVIVVPKANLVEVLVKTKQKIVSDEKREKEVLRDQASTIAYLQKVTQK